MFRYLFPLTILALTSTVSTCSHLGTSLQSAPPAPSETQASPALQDVLPADRPSEALPNWMQTDKPQEESGSTKPPIASDPDVWSGEDANVDPETVDPESAAKPDGAADAGESPDYALQAPTFFPALGGVAIGKVEYLTPVSDPDPVLERAILSALPDYNSSLPPSLKVRYAYNRIDLNGDSNPEVMVYLMGAYTCGSGGCNLLVLEPVDRDYRLISNIRLVQAPVLVSSEKTAGWQNLVLYLSGGGLKPRYAQLQFDGTGYPTNPSVAADVPANSVLEGIAVLADDLTPETGVLLEAPQG